MHALKSASRSADLAARQPVAASDDEHDEEQRRDREVPDRVEERGRAQERLRSRGSGSLRRGRRGSAAGGVRAAAGTACASREIAANEKRYESASTPNGRARATAKSAPPAGGPTIPTTATRPCCTEIASGSCGDGTTERSTPPRQAPKNVSPAPSTNASSGIGQKTVCFQTTSASEPIADRAHGVARRA